MMFQIKNEPNGYLLEVYTELGGKLMVEAADIERESIVKCLCCKHCLPPAERIDGKMCNESECNYEEA